MNTPIHTYIESLFHPQKVEIVRDATSYLIIIRNQDKYVFLIIEESQLNNHETLIQHIQTQIKEQEKQ